MALAPMLDQLYPFARAALFQLDAERAHHWSLAGLRWLEELEMLAPLAGELPESRPVQCMGLEFPNPVGLAAGLDKEGNTIDAFGRLGFGFVEIGTITPRPQPGNPKPRLFRLKEHEAIINRMGFNNPGITQGVENVRRAKSFQGVVGFNIGKNKDTPNEDAVDDYLKGVRGAWPVADYIAVNLSSPNTPGLRDLQSSENASRLIAALKKEQMKLAHDSDRWVPIALKVAPDLSDEEIKDLSKVFLSEGLEGLIATNTTIERTMVESHALAGEAGGLSGAPLTSRSTDVIAAFHAHLGSRIPIIGVGGIMSGDDACVKINAGATLVQIYTGFIYKGSALVRSCIESLNKS